MIVRYDAFPAFHNARNHLIENHTGEYAYSLTPLWKKYFDIEIVRTPTSDPGYGTRADLKFRNEEHLTAFLLMWS